MIGETILHYKIIEKLGEGGMGIVYKAEDTKLKREVAIKVLPHYISANEEEKQRLEIEAQAAASLNHPNIATVHAIEETGDNVFIVMEFVDGKELKTIIETSDPFLQISAVIGFARQIGEGLLTAHEKGIVHRDIKSSNIMVTAKGQIKIMDFGLAKIAGGSQVTRMGTTLGTVAYMSPEQAKGQSGDQRSDIWAYGMVLYEMLAGKLPFEGAYEQAVMYSVINEEPEPLTNIRNDIPQYLSSIVNKCLQKDLSQRYQSVEEILTDINEQTIQKEIKTAVIEKPVSRQQNRKSRKVVLSSLALLTALILLWFSIPNISNYVTKLFGSNSALTDQHLLVLPLTNIGDDANRQIFCDGLVETITSKLTQLEQFHNTLWVVPASEVRRNKIESPGEAYKTFGVNLAISGSLQKIGDLLRLTLNLIDAKNLRQINSAVIDVNTKKLSLLQDESVTRLFQMLNLELNPQAEDVLNAGGTTVPGAYEFYLQGRGYLLRYENVENIDAAIGLFKHAVKLDTVYSLAYAGLGEAYWLKYMAVKDVALVDSAVSKCNFAYKLDSRLAPVNVTLGLIHSGTGKYEQAINDFNHALKADPSYADAYRGLAKSYESLKQLDRAELTYKKAIELKPDYWAGYNELGAFYYRNARYEDALEQFKQVTALTPDNYRGYNNTGAIYYLLERWEKAAEMFKHSWSLHKSYGVASNLGTLYYIQGKFSDAAKMYESALELNDKDQLIWGNLGSAYYWIPGERSKADKYYYKAIEHAEKERKVNPSDAVLISQLAGYYSMVGENKKALKLINEALKISPHDSQIIFRAGTTYEQLGDRKNAIDYIVKALNNGYSRSEIEHQPELKKLLADPDFKKLASKIGDEKE